MSHCKSLSRYSKPGSSMTMRLSGPWKPVILAERYSRRARNLASSIRKRSADTEPRSSTPSRTLIGASSSSSSSLRSPSESVCSRSLSEFTSDGFSLPDTVDRSDLCECGRSDWLECGECGERLDLTEPLRSVAELRELAALLTRTRFLLRFRRWTWTGLPSVSIVVTVTTVWALCNSRCFHLSFRAFRSSNTAVIC